MRSSQLPPLSRWLLGLVLAALVASALNPGSASGTESFRATSTAQTIALQPDAANGTDTSVLSATPTWNYGDNASLWVGRDPTSGGRDRSLLSFNLAGIPSNATVMNATLSLYETAGTAGIVQARRAMVPWTEGNGGRGWARVPITVRETAGVSRTLEPVGVRITFPAGSVVDPARDLLVWDGAREVPSQVYGYTYSGGQVTSALVYFDVSLAALGTKTFTITYSANGTAVPVYRQATWSSMAAWTAGPAGVSVTSATVADLDGDGKLEAVFGGANGVLYIANSVGSVIRSIQVSPTNAIIFPPQVVDLRHNGTLDIVVVTNDPSIVSLDWNGTVFWRNNAVPFVYTIPTFLDVNADGVLDMLYGGNMARVEALSGVDGVTVVQTYPVPQAGYLATVADLDGDGTPEILVGGDDGNVHAFTLGGTELWAAAPSKAQFLEMSLAYGDLLGDGVPKVVSGDFSTNGLEFALYASNGTTAWSYTTRDYTAGGQTLADVNGDGRLEDFFGNTAGTFYALAADGSLLWSRSAGTIQGGTPTIADLDKSGAPDVVFIDGATVTVYDGGGNVLHTWTIASTNLPLKPGQQEMASPMIADLAGDGTLEVLVPTGNGLQAFATGALDHDWRVFGYNLNHTNRALDGSSPNGTTFLQTSVGAAQLFPAAGASWIYRDGASPWVSPGGDLGPAEANDTGALGWMDWNVTAMVRDWIAGGFPNLGLFLMEANEATGPFHSFESSDTPVPTQRPQLTITYVVADNGPRILGRIPDQVRPENSPPFTIDLAPYASDPDTPMSALRWNVTGYDRSIIEITGLNTPGNHFLTVHPQPDAWGDMQVTYWLTDPQGNFDRQQAWINITYVDQPPEFSPPSVLVVQVDVPFSFDFGPYIADPDTPRTLLTFASNDTAHTSVAGFNVTFLYPSAYLNKWAFVVLTVGDGQYSVSKVVIVKVTADSPPYLRMPLPNITMWEGQTLRDVFNLDDYFTDPNDPTLYFSYGYSHLNITIQANHSVDIRAQAEWWGVEYVTFRATDPEGAMQEDTITVTVLWIDDPPVLGPVPDLVVHYDIPYSFNLEPYLSDPDTPLNQLTISVSTAYATVSGHLVTFLYPVAFNNTVQTVTITVSDGYLLDSGSIDIAIGTDYPPILQVKLEDRSFPEDTLLPGAYNLSVFFADPDGSTLYYSSGNENVTVSIDAWGDVALGAAPNWWGVERVRFRAQDPQGALAEDSVWITVTAVDDAPYILPIPTQYVNATTAYVDLTKYVGDIDTDPSELVLASVNPHALAIGRGLLLNFTEDGSYYIDVVASDGTLSNLSTVLVIVTLPVPQVLLQIPPWFLPILIAALVASAAAFIAYRRRKLEWAFLMTSSGILVSSVSRSAESSIDTDLITSMLTAIMDFARTSFSDETERNLEGLELGEKRVAIAKGDKSYLAVVYRGRTPGGLVRIMRALLETIEKEHGAALGDIVDTTRLGNIPVLLQKLVTRGSLPFAFVSFKKSRPEHA